MSETSTISEEKSWDDSWDDCVFDLSGTCLPMRREGLLYFLFTFLGMIQIVSLTRRMVAREINYVADYSKLTEWQLTLGRMGLLFLALGISIENLRLFLASLNSSWPDYVLHAANTTLANEMWIHHNRGYTNAQVFLWWYSTFLITLFAPLTIYSMTSMLHKRLRRAGRLSVNEYLNEFICFVGSSLIALFMMVALLTNFVVGPMRHGLRIVKVTGLWSLASNCRSSSAWAIISWLLAMIIIALIIILYAQREENPLLTRIITNNFFAVVMIVWVNTDFAADKYWLPVLSQTFMLLAIDLHRRWDAANNPDDFGRLFNEEAREPLLSQQEPLPDGPENEILEDDSQLLLSADDDDDENSQTENERPTDQDEENA
mmetsp:Transcript_2474/g.3779  ORF Transcript_2474/g.3779 Transcript_2474/m.3779 type:complete len:374 (-) Transcript_2474:19-1140(-)